MTEPSEEFQQALESAKAETAATPEAAPAATPKVWVSETVQQELQSKPKRKWVLPVRYLALLLTIVVVPLPAFFTMLLISADPQSGLAFVLGWSFILTGLLLYAWTYLLLPAFILVSLVLLIKNLVRGQIKNLSTAVYLLAILVYLPLYFIPSPMERQAVSEQAKSEEYLSNMPRRIIYQPTYLPPGFELKAKDYRYESRTIVGEKYFITYSHKPAAAGFLSAECRKNYSRGCQLYGVTPEGTQVWRNEYQYFMEVDDQMFEVIVYAGSNGAGTGVSGDKQRATFHTVMSQTEFLKSLGSIKGVPIKIQASETETQTYFGPDRRVDTVSEQLKRPFEHAINPFGIFSDI